MPSELLSNPTLLLVMTHLDGYLQIELVVWWHFNLELKLKPKPQGLLSGVTKGLAGVGRVLGGDSEDEEDDDDGEVRG